MESLYLISPPALTFRSRRRGSNDTVTSHRSSSCSSVAALQRKRSVSTMPTTKPTTKPKPKPTTTETTTISPPPTKKKVLVPIGFGTEEMEAVILVDVLRRAGAHVILASVEPELEVEASAGTRLVADASISNCLNQHFDLIALPGGMPGSARLRDCEILREITSKQAEKKRLYGAICAAPAVTLQPWGLIKRKQATCHPAFIDKLPTFWAVKSNIQVSGELTTSRGPGTAFEFALSLVEQLLGETVAKEVGRGLLVPVDGGHPRKEEFNKTEWFVDHNPQVLIPVANGSEEIEVVTLVDILRRAKVDVVVASVEKSVQIVASQDTKIVADKFIKNAAESIYDLIILPGGVVGAERLHKSKVLQRLLKEQEATGRAYGAICSSPVFLQKQGLLKDKRATAHPSVLSKLTSQVVDGAGVVIDGNLITSSGLATVTDFSLAILCKLFGHARARSVAEGLVFEYPRN
ncbi:hypothetical protein NE237_024169 [Protea cynaroides]|uniref:DJ-1/PfpI domain-containing protein n=1 Tax=Protea cynaroides TaxID=273540 RepID=A0A9Q0HEC2_9MAGN|nr:hypothetical protein NE237_024169 [Protea cynaroides]